jgi:DNA-binding CsgD family transcriptional regulator/tetratricopeptide (TPR) repeat protein
MLGGVVGRRAELAALTAAAGRAVDGSGSASVVVGEPGIGKTHLLGLFADAAGGLGVSVYAASGYELEQRRPFGVLLDALGVRPGVEDSWRARVAAPFEPQTAVGEPTATGFWVGEELLALIDELSTRAPAAVVVDDVQWADQASLAVIARMCRAAPQQRLAIVLSVRPPPRPADVTRLVAAVKAGGGLELTVGPLTDAEVADLIAAAVGAPPGDSLWRLLHRTGGSPLFVGELVAGLWADDALRIEADRVETDAVRIPASLSAAVRHHLAQLDSDTIEVLRLAAVLAGPFTLPQLGHVTGRRPVELYASVGAALEAGVLREDADRLRFAHDVIRTTLYDDIPSTVRAGLHRDFAKTLAAAGAPAVEVAEHYLRGATPGDRDAVDGLRRAATATAEHSPAAAADLLERAAGLLPRTDPDQITMAQQRARHLASAGRAAEAEALCRHVLQTTREPDAEREIRSTLVEVLFVQSRMGEALDQARRIWDGTEPGSVERTDATAGLSWALLTAGNLTEAERIAREAIRLAGVEHRSVVYTAYMTLAAACRFTARATEGLVHLDAAAAIAGVAPRHDTDPNPVELWQAGLFLDLDRFDEALRCAGRARSRAEDAGLSFPLAECQFLAGSTLYAQGEVDDAVAEYRAGLELADDLGTGWRLPAYGGLASIAVHRGDLGAAADLVADGEAYLLRTGAQPQLPLFLRAKAELLEAQGRPADALAVHAGTWRRLLEADVIGSVPFVAPEVVRLAVTEGDHDLAAAMTAAARTAAARLGTSTGEAAALRCHGLVHNDLHAFVAAADTVVDNPRPLVRAGAHEDAARALAAAGRVDDARRHLMAAIHADEQTGAVRDVDRVDAAARAAGIRRGWRGQRRRHTHGWESLTTTERRVADLVATGLSNPVIAERMYLSRRTVQTHVSHILTKTGLTSRVELAAAIASQGDGSKSPPSG